ncbi:MAG: nuclear transport factor 2 family protein [Bacteroidota bacterium]
MNRYPTLIFCLIALFGYSQQAEIMFQVNDRDQFNIQENPFKNFIGEWTLKEDSWTQNWGNGTETIKIPEHHTISAQINTTNSLLSIIDGPEPNGHIFWSYNPNTRAVHHLSSFGTIRAGVGEGTVNEKGDLRLKIVFEGEPKDTYRVYHYKWVSPDVYHMRSEQFTQKGTPTGLFYEGTFVRLRKEEAVTTRHKIEAILKVLDNNQITVEEQLAVYSEDVVHMAPGNAVHVGKATLGKYLSEQRQYGTADMKHEIVALEAYENIVIMRGQVTGTYYPKSGSHAVAFRTKNLFVFEANAGVLTIKKVIYNTSPIE